MSDVNVMNRFVAAVKADELIWYLVDNGAPDGVTLLEPSQQKPWTVIVNEQGMTWIQRNIPQAVRVWVVPGAIGDAFVQTLEAKP